MNNRNLEQRTGLIGRRARQLLLSTALVAVTNLPYGAAAAVFTGTQVATGVIDVGSDGGLSFYDNASAGDATINVTGNVVWFWDETTASSASFLINGGGVQFSGTATAGNATFVIENGDVDFVGYSNGGDATFHLKDGGGVLTRESGRASGRFILETGSVVNISNDAVHSLSSLQGTGGLFRVFEYQLEFGSDNSSTTFAGQFNGLPGGQITKIGTGTFTYSGTTNALSNFEVAGGGMLVNGSLANTDFNVGSAAWLGGIGTIGALDASGTIRPGGAMGGVGTLHVGGDVTFRSGSVLEIGVLPGQADLVEAGGQVSIEGGDGQGDLARSYGRLWRFDLARYHHGRRRGGRDR